jgi:hypothetical protein
MMELRALEAYPDGEWEALLEQCGGNPLHLPQVHLPSPAGIRPQYLLFDQAGSVVACGLALVGTRRRFRLFSPTRAFELVTPPASRGLAPQTRLEIYGTLLDHCRREGYHRLVIGHTWGDCLADVAPFAPHITDSYVEFVLNLEPSVDDILAGMHKNHRKNINRAQTRGLTVRLESSLPALLHLRQMQLASAERAASRQHGFAVPDEEFFRQVHEHVYSKGLGEVLLAFAQDECVGALAYLSRGTRGMTVRSGCTREGGDAYAMYLLHFALLKRAKEKGLLEMNHGGVPAEAEHPTHAQHGLYTFKTGFGGQQHIRSAVTLNPQKVGAHDH